MKKGQILIFAVVVATVVTILVTALISFSSAGNFSAKKSQQKLQALTIAEAGIDKAIYQLKQNPAYTGESNILFNEGAFSVVITDINSNSKKIQATGCIPNMTDCRTKKTISVNVAASPNETQVSFHYAVQIGDLGLNMYSNAIVNGNVYSNGNISGTSNSRINGDAYAVGTISSPAPTVTGTKYPGEPSQPLPQIDLEYWKNQANINNNPINGNYEINSCSDPKTNLGPRKITGYFRMNSNSCLNLTGPLYVQGNFEMNSNAKLYLDQSFGSHSTVIVVDGTIKINSNSYIYPTNSNPKGYIMIATTNTGSPAIELNSNAATGIFYALDGEIQINSNGKAVEIVGRKLTLNSNATLDYDSGLANTSFITGPGGTWNISKDSWQEVRE